MTLEQARASIGAEVVYKPCGNCGWGRERGVITSVNASFAFVRFGSPTPQACLPGDLTLAGADAAVTG